MRYSDSFKEKPGIRIVAIYRLAQDRDKRRTNAVKCRGVARAKIVGGTNKNFGHALYFSEHLLLPTPYTYFLIDFNELTSTILATEGGGNYPQTPPVATPLVKCVPSV